MVAVPESHAAFFARVVLLFVHCAAIIIWKRRVASKYFTAAELKKAFLLQQQGINGQE